MKLLLAGKNLNSKNCRTHRRWQIDVDAGICRLFFIVKLLNVTNTILMKDTVTGGILGFAP